jgi:hypothetical protein
MTVWELVEAPFWLNDGSGATIYRFADRVFVGEAVNATGNDFNASQGSIFPAFNPPTDGANWALRDSQLLAVASTGLIAVAGVTRASDRKSLPATTIGVAGFVVNDTDENVSSWALYGDVQHEANAIRHSFGLELAVKNKAGNATYDVYSGGTGTFGIWLAAGGDPSYGGSAANPSMVAIAIGGNSHTWNTGIALRDTGLTTIGGEKRAIDMAQKHALRWLVSAGVLGAKIRSDIDTADRDVSQLFENRAVSWYGDNDKPFFRITHTASGVNYVDVLDSVTTGAPSVRARGDDTNISLDVQGRGTGGVNVKGTGTNDSAAAGYVGEIIESTVLVGSAVALTSPNAANVTSISLTAGDWDVWGNVFFTPNAATSVTQWRGAVNTTSATLPTRPGAGGMYQNIQAALVPASDFGQPVGVTRISLSGTTTVYLVALGVFTVNTLAAYGYIGARRVR